jgi:hypothetical protein
MVKGKWIMEAVVKRDVTLLLAKRHPSFAMLKMDDQALFSSAFLQFRLLQHPSHHSPVPV